MTGGDLYPSRLRGGSGGRNRQFSGNALETGCGPRKTWVSVPKGLRSCATIYCVTGSAWAAGGNENFGNSCCRVGRERLERGFFEKEGQSERTARRIDVRMSKQRWATRSCGAQKSSASRHFVSNSSSWLFAMAESGSWHRRVDRHKHAIRPDV